LFDNLSRFPHHVLTGYAMETMESTAFEQSLLKLGLVNESQLAEVHEEIGRAPDLQHLIAALERKSYLTPWQRGKVLKGDTDGYILGGYKLLYKIQSGSFGRVYRAADPRDGRVVAVKVLRRRWSENEQRIEMFIREGKVGLMLKHPNIVEVLAINRDPQSGQYYIVMEFVEGGNLREILQIQPAKKMSVTQSLRIAEDCANGLYYAYSRGMTHRDIKLTNILISDTQEAKLVDFGLAQFFSAFARTEEEKVDRTVDYAGLERATEVKTGDVRSDIYFLGCVLYECLTGRSPLSMTKDKHARMRKQRFEEVRPIHPNETEGPPSVLLLVETMMALDPKDRYQTPSQLLDAIRRVRREVEGKSGNGDDQPPTRSVFLAEPDERLQDVLRDGLKDQGYRVFLAGDPMRALDRFHKQPFDGLIVDARATGDDGVRIFEKILDEAARRQLRCAAMLLLGEEQADRVARLPNGAHIAVIVETEDKPITYRKMSRLLKELMEAAHESEALPTLVRPAPLPPSPPPRPAPRVVEEPPVPTTRVVEVPSPVPPARVVELPPREPAPRVVEKRRPAREEIAPPKPRPRREPITPAAVSPPPPVEVAPPPAFMGFSVMTDDAVSLSEETAFPPARRQPEAPETQSLTPPHEEVALPPQREPVAEEDTPLPLDEEEAPPPAPLETETASTPVAYSESVAGDFPMLALEEGIVLPPPEVTEHSPQRQEAASQTRREEAASAPERKATSTPPPQPRKAPGSSPRRAGVVPPPSREESAPAPRQVEPRLKKELEPVMQHITHEDPLAPPDTHHWRDELGVHEKKEKQKVWIRARNFWESLTPTQKSVTGLVALGLVVGVFLLYMFSNMLIQSKFDKIREGMSKEEVEDIMGGPGNKVDLNPGHKGRGPVGPIKPETYKWEMGDKIITITFSNGKVIEGGNQLSEK
jgi:tRNA A-37 threonylcarbamoyl transferase component Bud32/CheY-like chemotaxis protein